MPTPSESFSLRAIAVGAFGPSLLFGLGQGAILPVIPLTARELGAPVPVAAFIVALIGIGSLVSNVPASLVTIRWGETVGDRRRGDLVCGGDGDLLSDA